MKKISLVVAVLLVVIFVSPGVVGKIAETAVNEQLDWAATGASDGELAVRLESFDSHWFTSHGVHYVELGDGSMLQSMRDAGAQLDAATLPKLRIDTHIDHGLIPVSSFHRDGGSLAPALGSAVSTMTIELADEDPIEIPGKVFSQIGLTGGVDSQYVLPAGSYTENEQKFVWKDGRLRLKANPSSGQVVSDARFEGFTVTGGGETVEIGEITFDVDTRPGASGIYIGDFNMRMENVLVSNPIPVSFGPMNLASTTTEVGDKVDSDVSMDFEVPNAPMLGDVRFDMQLSLLGADAVALKNLSDTANSLDESLPQAAMFSLLEPDLVRLLTGGVTVDVSQLALALPQGLVDANLQVVVPESDAADFSWGAVMQTTTGKASLSVPVAIVQLASMASPEASMLVTMGLLQQDGDLYKMDALYEKGLLTINGQPIPLPFPTS